MLAEELGHYWQTSKTAPDAWLDKAEGMIEGHGGTVLSRGHGKAEGKEAYMLAFELEGQAYKVVWPVLDSRRNKRAARIQAATLLHHDIKSKIVTAKVLGNRTAFFQYLVLSDGRTTAEVADPELMHMLPDLNRPLLAGGDVVNGEWTMAQDAP